MDGFAGLATIDGWAILSILAKSLSYVAALGAMGGVLFLAVFRAADPGVRTLARRIAVVSALAILPILAVRFGIQAARISGMGLDGAMDPFMLGIIWDGPRGTLAIWKAVGAVLVLGVVLDRAVGTLLSLCGALLIAVSQTLVGHSLGDPRLVLASLLAVHLLAAAFWVGALIPLHRAVIAPDGAALLHRFGTLASLTVPILIAAGVAFAWKMTGSVTALIGSAYGVTLLAKVAAVSGLLLLAARNKLWLVPAVAARDPNASTALRRTIKAELMLVAVILIATAVLTTVTTPPMNF
ncbi:CopD family protein [Jannaschia pohangensis]|nr:CopD family protein [Jannaschia pohangensis]